MARPGWYPDWTGKTVTLVASGPSAAEVDLEIGIGRTKFVAINNSWKLCPWADALHACDVQWWDEHKGCPEFMGSLKVCVDYRIRDRPKSWGVSFLHCHRPSDAFEMKQIGNVGWGGNSGYNCLNWVAQLYPKKIILVGYDMTRQFGAHWHEPHSGGLSNPTNVNIERWRRVMEWAHIPLGQAGITTINCSSISVLKKYPKMTFQEALDYNV
jgi:hypothetical protein